MCVQEVTIVIERTFDSCYKVFTANYIVYSYDSVTNDYLLIMHISYFKA